MTKPTPEQVAQWVKKANLPFNKLGLIEIAYEAYAAGAASMQPEIEKLSAELDKAQDEINCAEESLDAFACEFDDEKFNQGFDCLGRYVIALHEASKEARDALQSELAESLAQSQSSADDADCASQTVWILQSKLAELQSELEALRAQEEPDTRCWKCGEDGGTSCGAQHCGLLESEPADAPQPVNQMLLEAAKYCRDIFNAHELNRVDGEAIVDDALKMLNAAIAAAEGEMK